MELRPRGKLQLCALQRNASGKQDELISSTCGTATRFMYLHNYCLQCQSEVLYNKINTCPQLRLAEVFFVCGGWSRAYVRPGVRHNRHAQPKIGGIAARVKRSPDNRNGERRMPSQRLRHTNEAVHRKAITIYLARKVSETGPPAPACCQPCGPTRASSDPG